MERAHWPLSWFLDPFSSYLGIAFISTINVVVVGELLGARVGADVARISSRDVLVVELVGAPDIVLLFVFSLRYAVVDVVGELVGAPVAKLVDGFSPLYFKHENMIYVRTLNNG